MLAGVLSGRTNPGRIVVEPRWEWSPDQGAVRIEDGSAARDVDALIADGLDVVPVEQWALRSAQQVIARPRPGEAVIGAVDPRTGGLALGV
jgi:gamma-glutamyltranspeptidase